MADKHTFVEQQMSTELTHHGVKGMKWGIRKDRGKRNPNYSDQQSKRDSQIYGRRGSKRINRSMNEGDSVSTARSREKTRRDRVMSKNKYYRQGGQLVGSAAAALASDIGISTARKAMLTRSGSRLVASMMGQKGAALFYMALGDPTVRLTASIGAAKIASMSSGDLAVRARMRAYGYNPNRK